MDVEKETKPEIESQETETAATPEKPAVPITDSEHMLEKPSFFQQYKDKIIFGPLLIIIAILIGYIVVDKNKTPIVEDPILVLFNLEDIDPIATINGTEISLERYQDTIKELSGNAQQQGADLTDLVIQTQIKDQALTLLIDTTILLQKAQDANTEVTTEEVDAELSLIETQIGGSELLATELEKIGLTVEELKKNLEERIIITKYLESESGIAPVEVTDAEIEEFYTAATATLPPESTPALADIRGELEAQLTLQKQQEATATLINILKTDATIEIHI